MSISLTPAMIVKRFHHVALTHHPPFATLSDPFEFALQGLKLHYTVSNKLQLFPSSLVRLLTVVLRQSLKLNQASYGVG